MSNGRIPAMEQRREQSVHELPEIGKVKTGEKAKSAKGVEYPTSLDHFRFTGRYAEDVVKALGNDKPNKLRILFPSENVNSVCYERYEGRDTGSGKLLIEGNGVTFRAYDPDALKFVDVDLNGPNSKTNNHALVQKYKPIIRRVLTLRFLILDFKGVYGVWNYTTRADKSTIDQVIRTFDKVREQAGRITGIPFDLCVEKVKTKKDVRQKDGSVKAETNTFPVVTLVPNISAQSIASLAEHSGFSSVKFGVLDDEKIQHLALGSHNAEEEGAFGAVDNGGAAETVPEENTVEEVAFEEVGAENPHTEEPKEEGIGNIDAIINKQEATEGDVPKQQDGLFPDHK